MIDLTTLQSWTEKLGYAAALENPSTLRIQPREQGIVALPPFFVQCTEHWVLLSMFNVLDSHGLSGRPRNDGLSAFWENPTLQMKVLRRLLEANREMQVAKFALTGRDDILLCAELPTESLDQSEFGDAVERMMEYATTYRRLLPGVGV